MIPPVSLEWPPQTPACAPAAKSGSQRRAATTDLQRIGDSPGRSVASISYSIGSGVNSSAGFLAPAAAAARAADRLHGRSKAFPPLRPRASFFVPGMNHSDGAADQIGNRAEFTMVSLLMSRWGAALALAMVLA